MQANLPWAMRAPLAAASLVLAWACGGEANKPGAATPDSSTTTASTAAGDVNAPRGVSPTEAVAFMAAADQSEVHAAQIAMRKATNAEVRQFAQQMNREHSKAAHDDSELAKKLNVDLRASGNQGDMVKSVQSMAQQTEQKLNSTPKGKEFDRVYMDSQVQAHQSVLENLQRIAASGGGTPGGTGATGAGATAAAQPTKGASGTATGVPSTPQEAAQKMIPHVQQHLDKARQIQSKLGTAG